MIKHAIASVFNDPDSYNAGKNIAADLMARFGNERPDLLILFFTVGYNISETIKAIQEITDAPIIGCSGAGVITPNESAEGTYSMALMALKSSDIDFHPFLFSDPSPEILGEKLAEIAERNSDRSKKELFLVFPHGNGINMNSVFTALRNKSERQINCLGGAASNDYKTKRTLQIYNSQISDNGISGVYMCGDFTMNYAVSHGGSAMGLPKTITKADGNYIYEIDNMSAIDAIKKYCGDEPLLDFSTLLFHVYFAVPQNNSFDDIKLRAILDADLEKGYVVTGAEIPVGTKIKFGRRERLKVLACTSNMGKEIIEKNSK